MRAALVLLIAILVPGCAVQEGAPELPSSLPTSIPSRIPLPHQPAAEASALVRQLNATPGHEVAFGVVVEATDGALEDVEVELTGIVGGKARVPRIEGDPALLFVALVVPPDAPVGEHPLGLSVAAGGKLLAQEASAGTLRVLAPARRLSTGDVAHVTYVGRLEETGAVFDANDVRLQGLGFPRTSMYQPRGGTPLVVQTAPPNVVEGFHESVLGMQVGESRSFVILPDKAYGNATEEAREPRVESLERRFVLRNLPQPASRDRFEQHMRETGQEGVGDVNDTFELFERETGNVWRYRVVAANATHVSYALDAAVGERHTLYPFWTNGSVVEAIEGDAITFLTTPTTDAGVAFTARATWPSMTTVAEVNETHVVIRHTPPIGYRYNVAMRGQPVEHKVVEVTGTEIVATRANAHPLAGQALRFDVTVLRIDEGRASS